MEDKDLIQLALGIIPPWFVKELNLDTSKKRMDIYLDFIKGSKFLCPVCNELCPIHDTKERVWRHLDFFHYETYLHAKVPRIKCNGHGVKLIDLPWTRQNTGFTLFFEALIVAMCKEMPVASVADIVHIHEDSVWRILSHYVDKAKEERDISYIKTIGVDEIAVKKGHNYVTLFYDMEEARVIHIENGKGKDVFLKFRTEIAGKVDHEQIQYISMDMYPAFKSGAREYFPKATIVFDKFHVIKMMNDSVDRVRRTESKENYVLKNTRFMWLKNPDRLSEKENVIMEAIKNLDTKTAKAYQFRLALQRLWTIKEISIAREYLDKWYYWGTHSNIPEIISVSKAIKKHAQGILEAMKNGINNGVAEGINNKIKTAFKRSYGLKTEKYRNTMIYLMAGKLTLPTRC
jgi:transposase